MELYKKVLEVPSDTLSLKNKLEKLLKSKSNNLGSGLTKIYKNTKLSLKNKKSKKSKKSNKSNKSKKSNKSNKSNKSKSKKYNNKYLNKTRKNKK